MRARDFQQRQNPTCLDVGADVINMSTVPEVSLAKELGMEYATVAMSTDYDCWKENEESVTFEMILEIIRKILKM